MSCPSSPSGPITAVFLVGSSGSVELSFFSSTIERAASLRAQRHRVGQQLRRVGLGDASTYGCSNSPALELHPQDAAHGVVDPRHRVIWRWASSCAPKSTESACWSSPEFSAGVQRLGCRVRSVRRVRRAHSRRSWGSPAGTARISATAAQSASTKPSKPHSSLEDVGHRSPGRRSPARR